MLCLMWRPQQMEELFTALKGRFGAIAIMPLFPKAGSPAGRIVVRAVRGSRAPLALLQGVVLHAEDGQPTQLAGLLLNGKARLPFQ